MSDFFDQKSILTVNQLTQSVKKLIESRIDEVWVRGEISNYVLASSGHSYFTLKDRASQVRCVLFRSRRTHVNFELVSGLEVELLASPSMFEKRGEFQLIVAMVRQSGLGELFEIYEQRRKAFDHEGLFSEDRKFVIPRFPKAIGVVTSRDAAAFRDIVITINSRAPNVKIILYPSPVQGQGAGEKIAEMVRLAGERNEVDVLVICRGGGSLEDLWEFNSESLVRAIADSRIPVVSGVGHETDVTLVDFVSDYRAATPTAAATAVTYSRVDVQQEITRLKVNLKRILHRRLETLFQNLDYLNRRLVHPSRRNKVLIRTISDFAERIRLAAKRNLRIKLSDFGTTNKLLSRVSPKVTLYAEQLDGLELQLKKGVRENFERERDRLNLLDQNLAHLDPHQVLTRGYGIVRDQHGAIIRGVSSVVMGDELSVTLSDGELVSIIKSKRDKKLS